MYVLFCVVSICGLPLLRTQQPPRSLIWNNWAESLMALHLVNMTEELIKDVTYKLNHAEKIKEKHAHSITYELGTIAAGIQERFFRMLKIYRKYANLEDFATAKYTIPEIMNAYHVIQGDYNEIRLEKGIFYDIVQKHESTSPTTKKFSLPPGFKFSGSTLPPNFNLGRQGMTWRPQKPLQ